LEPTEELKHEHRVIERVLRILEKASRRLEAGDSVPPEVFGKSIDFIRNFADKCHHGKEQDTLFPVLVEHGIPKEGGPIGVMLAEHDEGRAYVRGMAEALSKHRAGDVGAAADIAHNARGYAQLLEQHIQKEDNVLYPMAERVLSEEEKVELADKFEQVEREVMGEGKHEEYLRLVEGLEKVLA